MKHLKHHALHILMCAPMLLIAVLAIAGGAGATALLFPLVCVLMMMVMMGGMSHGGTSHDHQDGDAK